jgi:hypothetical protein
MHMLRTWEFGVNFGHTSLLQETGLVIQCSKLHAKRGGNPHEYLNERDDASYHDAMSHQQDPIKMR